jgi:hypothetical protein
MMVAAGVPPAVEGGILSTLRPALRDYGGRAARIFQRSAGFNCRWWRLCSEFRLQAV